MAPISIINETKKAVARAKDGVGKNSVQTITLPGLNEVQANAVGGLIAAARGIALMRQIPISDEKELNTAFQTLRRMSQVYTVNPPKNPSDPYSVSFTTGIERGDDNLPVYDIEQALPFVEKSLFIPGRQRPDCAIDFGAGKHEDVAVLLSKNKDSTLVTADLVRLVLLAHGHNTDECMGTMLDGMPLKSVGRTGTVTAVSGKREPMDDYPAVVVKRDIYEEVMRAELTQERKKGS